MKRCVQELQRLSDLAAAVLAMDIDQRETTLEKKEEHNKWEQGV